ncbi:MAG TPA: WbqC family protein [Bacteroidales bacterium]|nr:WbqC family protein [Bacteroidales bacterium]
MSMNIIVSQPRYLPALNYINRLANADTFVLLDTVQRQARGWENRNKLLCNGSAKWLTIPIESSSRALIYDTNIKGSSWIEDHKNTVRNYYINAPYFDESIIELYYSGFEELLDSGDSSFTAIIEKSIQNLESIFSFECSLIRASSLNSNRDDWTKGPEELKRIAKLAGASAYISGPNAKEYGIEDVFKEIDVRYHDYNHPVYDQKQEKFIDYLGFFDAVFYAGVEKVSGWVNNELNTVKNINID